jgi:hypothetical protein
MVVEQTLINEYVACFRAAHIYVFLHVLRPRALSTHLCIAVGTTQLSCVTAAADDQSVRFIAAVSNRWDFVRFPIHSSDTFQ